MATTRPYFKRSRPSQQFKASEFALGGFVDLRSVAPPDFADDRATIRAEAEFERRSAAVIAAAVGALDELRIKPDVIDLKEDRAEERSLSEYKASAAGGSYLATGKCLSLLAYADYFGVNMSHLVDKAILGSSPGYCGTFGPDITHAIEQLWTDSEGNFDMNQQQLIAVAYLFSDRLEEPAREKLIRELLGKGKINRPGRPIEHTSGPLPDDWRRAGHVGGIDKDILESENHILMMLATRYLVNQLMYQRTHESRYDNHRNGGKGRPACRTLVLDLLRRCLSGDFSEYNAKNYQTETRWALLNLCSFAYDHEVRLGGRMVLDYLSARYATSSSDLRRLVPFRRRNSPKNSAVDSRGFMQIPLTNQSGADPLYPYFAVHTGNTRSAVIPTAPGSGNAPFHGLTGTQGQSVLDIVSTYRVPPAVLDLMINDTHRRFYQRLHRTPRYGEIGGNRNADNHEITFGSPSYLITAGGAAADYAIDPRVFGLDIVPGQEQQLGVAVTTTLIPTTRAGGTDTLQDHAAHVVQVGCFSSVMPSKDRDPGSGLNYGVAPDLLFGHQVRIPRAYATDMIDGPPGWRFLNRVSKLHGGRRGPGFYLAVVEQNGIAVVEAFDTWLNPSLAFEEFRKSVLARNGDIRLESNRVVEYTTTAGDRVELVIWRNAERGQTQWGAVARKVDYLSAPSPALEPIDLAVRSVDSIGDAGNVVDRFLNGTVLNALAEGVVRIDNHHRGEHILLDMANPLKPTRTDEAGAVESAGSGEEVWVDFDSLRPEAGDAFHPFHSVAGAEKAVAPGGTVRVVPGFSPARTTIGHQRRYRIVAPIGDVIMG